MSDFAAIRNEQQAGTFPMPQGLAEGTNLLLPPVAVQRRLAHFSEQVYDLSPGSNLTKFLSAILGDAGIGQLRKRTLLARLHSTLQGTSFLDLDRFYGALFGIERRVAERLDVDPHEAVLTSEDWDDIYARDASYRSRIEQFAGAIQYGGTAIGMELIAEALLSVDCEVIESFATENSWFTVVPKRAITAEERHDLMRVLRRFKPTNTFLRVEPTDAPAYTAVAIRRAVADSEYWEVRSRVVSRPGTEGAYLNPGTPGDPQEQPRPPFSAYQGEEWSYVGDLVGVMGYGFTYGQTVSNLYERVMHQDGSSVDYPPYKGVRSPVDVVTARAAADGVMVSHSYGSSAVGVAPAQTDLAAVAPLYVDGMSVEDLATVSEARLGFLRERNDQSFWSTPPRHSGDPTQEALEARLSAERRVNYLSCQVPHFPHRFRAEYWDEANSEWVLIRQLSVSDSVPAAITPRAELDARHLHPQHSLNGHWIPIEIDVGPLVAKNFRVVLTRMPSQNAPRTPFGTFAPYSLGVRSLDIGYRVRSRDDIPRTGGEVGNAIDILGSRVSFSIREKPAANVLDGDTSVSWLSEPQPLGSTVVNLYLDVRASDGQGQVIDSFYLDPVRPGPMLNLYYALNEGDGTFEADRSEVTDIVVTGSVTDAGSALDFDASSEPACVEIDNSYLQLDIARPWSVGMVLLTDAGSDGPDVYLFSMGGFEARLALGKLTITSPFGEEWESSALTYNDQEMLRLVVNYADGAMTARVQNQVGTSVSLSGTTTGTPVVQPSSVCIGSDSTGTGDSNFRLFGFTLKQNAPIDPADFFASYRSYTRTTEYAATDDGRTDNALLRWDPIYMGDGALGFVGGPANLFAAMEWTPVPRDFHLQKGHLRLPPVKAKFWKFEFSNLVIEPFEVHAPVQRRIKFFPREAMPDFVASRDDPGVDIPGYATARTLHQTFTTNVEPTEAVSQEQILPTSMLYAEEPTGPQRLRELAWVYGFIPWHIGSDRPRFRSVGRHRYNEVTFEHSEKIAFFVGLREITAYRRDYSISDNPMAIVERFLESSQIEANTGFSFIPGGISSGQLIFAEAESIDFTSLNDVDAIQFATQQTDAVQLLYDDDFRSTSLPGYTWDDEGAWHTVGDAYARYLQSDQSVIIGRDAPVLAGLNDAGGLLRSPDHPVLAQHVAGTPSGSGDGGLESPIVRVSPEGVIHAAVRFTALTSLTNPLTLQIVDDSDVVVAEKDITAQEGDTVEEILSYVLGSYSEDYAPSYELRGIVDGPVQPVFSGEDELDDLGPGAHVPGRYYKVRLIQTGASGDTWKIDRFSLFDESIVWEFSNDGGTTYTPAVGIRNNPYGVLTFADPGNDLKYRVRAFRSNLAISALQVRPWYVDLPTLRLSMIRRGPNESVYDQFPPITEDPEFKAWHHPVPRWWWLAGRRFGALPVEGDVYQNEYSSTYERAVTETLPEITDTVTSPRVLVRDAPEDISSIEDAVTATEL